jgi:hypothetical protein
MVFVAQRVFTKAFWLLVITTFFGILMYDIRFTFKDMVFQDAIVSLKRSGWKDWNPKTPFDRN